MSIFKKKTKEVFTSAGQISPRDSVWLFYLSWDALDQIHKKVKEMRAKGVDITVSQMAIMKINNPRWDIDKMEFPSLNTDWITKYRKENLQQKVLAI